MAGVKRGGLWTDYEGLKNTEDNLVKKAKAFAPALIYFSTEFIESFKESLKRDLDSTNPDEKRILESVDRHLNDLLRDVTFLFFHYTDRWSYQLLKVDIKKRNIFFDALLEEIMALLTKEETKSQSAHFINKFMEDLDRFQAEYGKYNSPSLKVKKGGLDIPWVFSQRISRLLIPKKYTHYDLEIYITVIACMTAFMNPKTLELDKLLSEKGGQK